MTTEDIECKQIKLTHAVGGMQHLSFFEEIGFLNKSITTIYVGDVHGNIYTIYPAKLTTSPANTCDVFVRLSAGGSRKFDATGKECNPDGLVVTNWTIKLSDIFENKFVYIKELGLIFVADKRNITEFHPKLDVNIDKRIASTVGQHIRSMDTAPIKVFANDASGTIDTIWLCIGDHVFSTAITNEQLIGTFCKISIGTSSGRYFEYSVDLEKTVREGEVEEVITQDGVFAVSATEGTIRNWKFKKNHEVDGCIYTKAQLTKLIAKETNDAKNRIAELEQEIATLKLALLKSKEETKIYMDLYNGKESRNLEQEKQEFEREKREYERLKLMLEKEKNKDTQFYNTLTTVAKTLSILIPIGISIVAYTTKKKT